MNKVIIDVVVCVVWLALCIFLITRLTGGKVGKIIGTSFLFILFTALFAGSSFGQYFAAGKINEIAAGMEEDLRKEYSANPLVKSGVDVSNAPQAIAGIESIIMDKINTIGAKGFVVNELYKAAGGQVSKILRTKTDTIVSHAEDGKITISTIFNALKDQIFKIVKTVVLVFHLIAAVFMLIHLLRFLFAALRKKPKKAPAAPQPTSAGDDFSMGGGGS